ncbi:putative PurR-regulated permease PerM [Nocardioides zeae]|uniref:PurR-regulated permease PerM n=2 Tax=Nocardioides zeae TaxID=1457234 RepID=A0ACC6ID03_9ACTN|nr:putative PurR-regulated permease PerM [Nocardioides zeae]MDR6175687.1 putative PurR-regulated permease PerM [Nocardioides zeae]MDR6208616.1 putative PurR-regulated permease PerM [Nocardioides zeae]
MARVDGDRTAEQADEGRAPIGDPVTKEPDDGEVGELRRRLAALLARRSRDEEQHEEALRRDLRAQLTAQWAAARAERRPVGAAPLPIAAGESNLARAEVPWGLDLAAAWAWRFLVIVAATVVLVYAFWQVRVVTLPLLIALLVTSLGHPVVRWGRRIRVPASLSAIVVVVGGLGFIALLITFVSQQVIDGMTDLADKVVMGLGEVRTWLKDGPLNASDSQIDGYITQAQQYLTESGDSQQLVRQVTEVGTTLTHIAAGFFIVLFASFFFLADGARIWSWCVRLAPRGAREQIDSSGRVAWVSLTQFMRATVIVALVDAIGIMIVAVVLDVPLVAAIGVLVFIGAFVPMIGATIAGSVAVLVALVDQGPWVALLMLGGVILVQQIEGHILQPFLMGRFVSVHPLGVIVAIGIGVLVAGIAGALIAVPLAAAVNAVVLHLADETAPPPPSGEDDMGEELGEDPGVVGDFDAVGGRPE